MAKDKGDCGCEPVPVARAASPRASVRPGAHTLTPEEATRAYANKPRPNARRTYGIEESTAAPTRAQR